MKETLAVRRAEPRRSDLLSGVTKPVEGVFRRPWSTAFCGGVGGAAACLEIFAPHDTEPFITRVLCRRDPLTCSISHSLLPSIFYT